MHKDPVWKYVYTRWSAFVHDVAWIPPALLLGYWVRFNFDGVPPTEYSTLGRLLFVALPVQAAVFWAFGLYRGLWRFASVPDLIRILNAVMGGTLLIAASIFLLRLEGVPRTLLFLYAVFLVMGVTGPRLVYRWYTDHRFGLLRREGQRALILGAGRAGEMLVRDLLRYEQYCPVAFLDDAPEKTGRELHGVRVIGPISALEQRINALAIEVVLIAMPSASAALMRRVMEVCNRKRVACVTLPSLDELAEGRVGVAQLREIRIEDLLGREPVRLDNAGLHAFLYGKRVLITGAGGSIGSELCRQVCQYVPARVIVVDSSEFNLYNIDQELRRIVPPARLTVLLGDVRDGTRMRSVFQTWRPEVVLHAAAYKHVPLVEENPTEGIKTNVFGTRLIADLAVEYGAEKFLLVSTDKAVNPTNVMGVSKRVAEIYCQALDGRSSTAFITIRFGNVLGSAGSVVPLFRKQIEAGGPVTVTHPEITRFFMTIPEAVSLILQAAAMGQGGEVFVLEMGEPVRIVDLARQMIRLYGREPDSEIEIKYIGLRPGEKMHEELFHSAENLVGTRHPKIMQAEARKVDWIWLQQELALIASACESHDADTIRLALRSVVPEFENPSIGPAVPDGAEPIAVKALH
jgi:FlaA1/EpsC-like NDP-sugar epimerase